MALNAAFYAPRTRAVGRQPTAITPDVIAFNIRCLYIEVACAGILGAILATYNSLFAVRLGASGLLIGILTAAPALVGALTSIPAARFLDTRENRMQWIFGSLLFMRIGYLPIVLFPLFPTLFPIGNPTTATWAVIWMIIMTAPTAFFSNGFNALLAELVPERQRVFVFSRRTILYSATTVVTLLIAGWFLNRVVFPLNYQIVYLFGIITVLGSQYFLMQMVIPPHMRARRTAPVFEPKISGAKAPEAVITPPIRKMLVNSLVYQLGLQLPGPLFVIYYVNTLHANDQMISFSNAAGTVGAVFGLLMWEGLLRRRTYGWAMRTATLLTWIFPFTVALATNFNLIIAGNFIVNTLHPGFDLTSINVMFNLSPPDKRNLYMSYYTTAANVSTFIGPLAAAPLAGLITIPAVMLLAGGLRFTGGLLFRFNRIPEAVQS